MHRLAGPKHGFTSSHRRAEERIAFFYDPTASPVALLALSSAWRAAASMQPQGLVTTV